MNRVQTVKASVWNKKIKNGNMRPDDLSYNVIFLTNMRIMIVLYITANGFFIHSS